MEPNSASCKNRERGRPAVTDTELKGCTCYRGGSERGADSVQDVSKEGLGNGMTGMPTLNLDHECSIRLGTP